MYLFHCYRRNFLLGLVLCCAGLCKGQSQFPTVGEPMPAFALERVSDYKKTKVNSAALKGRWYILDFWVMGCQPCIASFPAMTEMVRQFKGKVDIFSVGIGGSELESYYASLKKKKSLNIPIAFDLQLAGRWQVSSFPHIFIVDDRGILRTITSETNAQKLSTLISTGRNEFRPKEGYRPLKPNDVTRLYFVGGNGGDDSSFLFRSVLARSHPDYSVSGIANLNQEGPGYDNLKYVSASNLKNGLFQISGASLLTLYNTAFFGQAHAMPGDSIYSKVVLAPHYQDRIMWPVLQVRDSSNFRVNYKTFEGFYTYSVSVPPQKDNRQAVMRAMQLDLLKCFGYDARIEQRPWPVWKLVVTDPKKAEALRTKGADPQSGTYTPALTHFLNLTPGDIVSMIANNYPSQIFLDHSALHYKLDLRIEGSLGQLEVVRQSLQAAGLDLIGDTPVMNVLVISDPGSASK